MSTYKLHSGQRVSGARAGLSICAALTLTLVVGAETAMAGPTITVTNMSPRNASNGVSRSVNISVSFEAALNTTTVSATSFKVSGRQSGIHTGALTFALANTQVTLDPTTDFLPGEDVVVTLTAAIESSTGKPLVPYTFQFRAGVVDCSADSSIFGRGVIAYGKSTASWGGRIADLNGDGLLDVISVMSSNLNHLLYLNNGNGGFTTNVLAITGDANDVDVGDVNGDGKPDLFIVNYFQACQVYTNSGSGTFGLRQTLDSTANIGFGVRLGDLDGDGDLDAFVANSGPSARSRVYLNSGTGLFTTNQLLGTNYGFGVDLGDLDGDGDLDAFLTQSPARRDLCLFNNGSGLFTTNQSMGATNSVHIRLGDLDGDGDLDTFAANGGGACRVYLNNGSGQFTTNSLIGAGNYDGLGLGDLNGDGDLDAYVGALTNLDVVFANNGSASFTTNQILSRGNARAMDLGDTDGDGDLDAFAFTAGIDSNAFWINEPPPPALTPIFLAPGSPVVSANPSPSQNNAGDNFDLATAGNAAVTVDRCGFGDLGQIYFNYDATNLYVGGRGLNVGGTNNGLVLFLGFNSLTNDRTNLTVQTGDPKGLDNMHNLRFFPPMDIAVLLGDESADTNASSFNLTGGQDLGQGAYYLGASTFPVVTNARISQFDGTNSTATASADDDGNRLTDRWEVRIPWSDLNAVNSSSVTSFYVAGVLVGATNGNNRYLSNDYIGTNISRTGATDLSGNFAYATVTVYGATLVLPGIDSDADGMPNYFELQNGLSPTNAGDATSDTDGDGYQNVEEFIAGSYPTNAGSYFTAGVTSPVPQGVQFNSVTGRLYIVEYRDRLAGAPDWQVLSNNVVGIGGSMSVADSTATNSRNYRVKVKMGP